MKLRLNIGLRLIPYKNYAHNCLEGNKEKPPNPCIEIWAVC